MHSLLIKPCHCVGHHFQPTEGMATMEASKRCHLMVYKVSMLSCCVDDGIHQDNDIITLNTVYKCAVQCAFVSWHSVSCQSNVFTWRNRQTRASSKRPSPFLAGAETPSVLSRCTAFHDHTFEILWISWTRVAPCQSCQGLSHRLLLAPDALRRFPTRFWRTVFVAFSSFQVWCPLASFMHLASVWQWQWTVHFFYAARSCSSSL